MAGGIKYNESGILIKFTGFCDGNEEIKKMLEYFLFFIYFIFFVFYLFQSYFFDQFSYENDEIALKANGKDMRCIVKIFFFFSVFSTNYSRWQEWMNASRGVDYEGKRLCFPLMSMIDFKGYRVIAMTVLPIKDGISLRYGSDDISNNGIMIYRDEIAINLAKKVCEKMNIASQKFSRQPNHIPKEIYGPYDIEIHLGQDGR